MLSEKAYAKINLTLDVTGKRADGYHDLKTVMQSVSLYDVITAEIADGITIECQNKNIPLGENNTCYKAASAFFEHTSVKGGVRIGIEKNIPSEAGLGGGSADAAAVLRILNEIYDTRLTYSELEKIAVRVGADVPFCIRGGRAVCEGIGEKITPLKPSETLHVLLAKPAFGISTPKAYQLFDEKNLQSKMSTEKFLEALEKGEENPYAFISNDLENALSDLEIAGIRMKIYEFGAIAAQMSGSGSCVFGLFSEREAAKKAAGLLEKSYPDGFLPFIYVCKTI